MICIACGAAFTGVHLCRVPIRNLPEARLVDALDIAPSDARRIAILEGRVFQLEQELAELRRRLPPSSLPTTPLPGGTW